MIRALVFAAALLSMPIASAQLMASRDRIGIDEHLGAALPLEAKFVDDFGQARVLRDVLGRSRPTILVLSWFECPMLCELVQRGVARAVIESGGVGDTADLLTISMDPRDGSGSAHARRVNAVRAAGLPPETSAWPHLVGTPESIEALTTALGFRYAFDAPTRQFAHPAALFVISPDGRIANYMYGVEYPIPDLKRALSEAAAGRTVSTVEKVMMACFRFLPSMRRYGTAVETFFRIGGFLIAAALVAGLVVLHRRERGAPP